MTTTQTTKEKGETMKASKFVKEDCGCFVDGALGRYMVDAIVSLARHYGFDTKCIPACECEACMNNEHDAGDGSYTEFGNCEFSNEAEDDATAFLNDKCAVEDCYWGRNEQGDFGLWENES